MRVEYCIGIGSNMFFLEYHVVILEDEDEKTKTTEPCETKKRLGKGRPWFKLARRPIRGNLKQKRP